jgi:hypothetical protein
MNPLAIGVDDRRAEAKNVISTTSPNDQNQDLMISAMLRDGGDQA